ncbi:MAG: hypothetical protein OXT74_18115 [Candidatus Poribacteria bacterium]|nr:hypothetical protein [Candidatus Poribacteria bacterium]
MASRDFPSFAEADEKLEYHLRKIRDIIPGYIGENREERDIHFKAVGVCLHHYECDLKSVDTLDGGGEEFVKMLNEALTELMGYFRFKFVPDDQGEYIEENIAVIFAYFLEKGTLELRDLARPPDKEME